MRTIMKLLAVCMSCILLVGANVQAVEKTLQMDKIPEKHPYFDDMWDYADSHYGYVSYGWKGGNCMRHTIENGRFQSKKILLKGKTKKYAKKHNGGCEWTDAKGNFYFLTSNYNKNKYVSILNKVDKKGRLVKRINLNKWLKITKESDNAYHLFVDQVEEHKVIASYSDDEKSGYVIFDRNSGKVKRQIVYSNSLRSSSNGMIACYQKKMLFGCTYDRELLYGEISKGKTITLPSGNKIKYQKVKSFKIGEPLPRKEKREGESFVVLNNQVYLLTSAGYYQINTKNLSLKKLASVEGIPFWETESKNPVTIELMPLSKKKYIIKQGHWTHGEGSIRKYTFWQGTIS